MWGLQFGVWGLKGFSFIQGLRARVRCEAFAVSGTEKGLGFVCRRAFNVAGIANADYFLDFRPPSGQYPVFNTRGHRCAFGAESVVDCFGSRDWVSENFGREIQELVPTPRWCTVGIHYDVLGYA